MSVSGDDLSAGLFQFGDEVGRGLSVGDDGVDGVESAEGGDGASVEFGVVGAEATTLSRLEHGALDVDEERMGVGNAVHCDPASAHDRDVRMHLREGLHGEWADQHTESRINHASCHQHLNAVVGAKVVRDWK